MPYRYQLGPFVIESAVPFPELRPCPPGLTDRSATVTIELGAVPETLDEPVAKRPFYQAAPEDFLLNVPSVARYRARQGTTVTIQPHPGSLADDWRPFFLGPVLGALCQQCGYLILHASTLAVNGTAVAFAGSSRAGKSTLAAWLNRAGFPLLTDDLCIVDTASAERPLVYSGYPTMRLWADALEHLGTERSSLQRVRGKLKKYLVPVHEGFQVSAMPLSALYQLQEANGSTECVIAYCKGMEKVSTLLNATHRRHFLKGLGLEAEHFQQCARVARRAAVGSFNRPWGMEHRERVVDALRHHLERGGGGGE